MNIEIKVTSTKTKQCNITNYTETTFIPECCHLLNDLFNVRISIGLNNRKRLHIISKMEELMHILTETQHVVHTEKNKNN